MYLIKYLKILLFMMLIVLLLVGCWDRKEVNDLAIITAAAVDQKEELLELSVQVFIPRQSTSGSPGSSGGGSAENPILVRSAEGRTVAEAMSKLQEKVPRTLFWGHAEVFILSEDVAKKDIRPRIEFFIRHPQLRERAYIYMSKDKAKDVLSLMPPIERNTAEVLRELANLEVSTRVTTKDLMEAFSSQISTAIIPRIEILKPEDSKEEKATIPYITGTAVFKKGKMVGHVDSKTTRGLLWLRDEISLAVVTVETSEKEGYVSMNLIRSSAELIPKIVRDKWTITMKIETEDDIIQNASKLDVTDEKVVKMLEKELKDNLEKRIQLALDQIQKEMNADVFGFAEAFRRKYPKEWNEAKNRWDEIFPTIEVTFDTQAKVRRPGMVKEPAILPDEEVKE